MCGICGIIAPEAKDEAGIRVRQMMRAMENRGPDAEGFLQATTACVGMRRLSIIDIEGGSQPVWNETRTLAVVYNGEIYNFRTLHDELARLGHRFQSFTDTEIIVHAYEEWGESCVKRMQGMFAFALIEMPGGANGKASRVFLARDPLGIKPLYYAVTGGSFLFASEVRALLASGIIPRALAPSALRSYLLFGSVSEPETFLENVFSLPPGHFMSISATRPVSAVEPKSYWQVQPGPVRIPGSRSERGSSPARHVRALLEKAVERHLIADVPIGIFLSSGLDSTAIAALASRVGDGIHTFTVAFPDIEFSEGARARETAATLKMRHSELTLTSQEMLTRLGEAITGLDQPSMDGINTYFVSWAAHEAGLKVALSGLGSDELFGGYSTFRTTPALARVAQIARLWPPALRAWSAGAIGGLALKSSPDARRKALAVWLNSSSLPNEYFFARTLFTPSKVAEAFEEDSGSWATFGWWKWLSAAVSETGWMDDFTKVSWLESRSYLVNTLLRDTDAMSMHHSLEVRVPFLDSGLVEYIFSLPQECKYNSGQPKALLIEALADVLPMGIVTRRKRTFTFPWDNWLRGSLGETVAKGLEEWSPVLEPHLRKDFALGVWRDFISGRTSWSRPWSLYVLNEWVKLHITAARNTPFDLGVPADSSATIRPDRGRMLRPTNN